MIFENFGLNFTQKVKEKILKSSSAHNPVEQQAGKEYIRNSKENIYNWKKRLSQPEINRIKQKISDIAELFYNDREW